MAKNKLVGYENSKYLIVKLVSIGFKQLVVNKCKIHCNDITFIVYVDDGMFLGPTNELLIKGT